MRTARLAAPSAILALAVLGSAPPAEARDPWLGLRIGYYTEVDDPFVGGELLLKLAPSLYLNPNLEWVLIDGGRYFTLNADAHYDLPTHRRTMVWVGAGLAMVNVDPEGPPEGDTDLGLNVFGGVGRRTGSVIPYVQVKAIVKDDTELVLAFGVRF